jgi:hypothetical protein
LYLFLEVYIWHGCLLGQGGGGSGGGQGRLLLESYCSWRACGLGKGGGGGGEQSLRQRSGRRRAPELQV